MEKISFFSADFRDGRIRIGNKTYTAGTFATYLLNQYYKEDTAARISAYVMNNWAVQKSLTKGYLNARLLKKTGDDILEILKALPKLKPFNQFDIESERQLISETFTEENGDYIVEYFRRKSFILAMDDGAIVNDLPPGYDEDLFTDAEELLSLIRQKLYFYDDISSQMRKAFEGLTEFCNRLDEAERFDEPHLLPIALDIFVNEKLDVTSEYVAMRKTAKSKTMVTARRMYFDNYYSFVLTDFFEGLHYGHYPRRCPICKRYFLMTSARRQVYCNGISPYTLKGKSITCRKYAARMKEKELSEGNPINPIYKIRCSAIRVEQKRSTITAEFAAMALKVAKEYWQRAKFDDDYANGQYKIDMKRENLYMETDRRLKQK